MMLIKRATMTVLAAATAVILTACTAGEAPLETSETYVPEPEVDAATLAPCEDQFAFQRELNGAPDETAFETINTQGKSVNKEMYWYEDMRMVIYFTYADGETWCNVWNESGVNWGR